MSRFADGRIKVFMNLGSTMVSVDNSKKSGVGIYGLYFTFIPDEGLTIDPILKISNEYMEIRRWYSSYYVVIDETPMALIINGDYHARKEHGPDCNNLNGQKLIQRKNTEPANVVNVSGLTAGIYFVKVVSDNGVVVGKFVKK